MARRLRLQSAGAMYHVINRGNYRRDVFDTVGAAKAFEAALEETCVSFRWRLHAYVLMRNHFHLALETPEPNLVEGMHWLQSTFATRFNRFRSERGHLFQGRYQALLIENAAALGRVANYIHLNPVRAHLVEPLQAAAFRWSSLARFIRSDRPTWLSAVTWLPQLGLSDSAEGWRDYVAMLAASVAGTDGKEEEQALCRGWAIGTAGWRQAVAQDHKHLALQAGVAAHELREFKQARWATALEQELARLGKTKEDIAATRKGVLWKCLLASRLRSEAGASYEWMANELHMGSANSVRSHVTRYRGAKNQQLSA